MRILMLSWEYPPRNVGGISTHVYNIAQRLYLKGQEVHVIACSDGSATREETQKGVNVHRVTPSKIEPEDFLKWIMQLNFAMVEEAVRLMRRTGSFNIIHAHDWLTAYCAKALKWSFHIPMVSTIHSTEHGRNNGSRTEMQRYISSTENMLCSEAWKVIVCSNYMRQQVSELFKTPWHKVWVIPNGVDVNEFKINFNEPEFRRRYAMDNEKIVFYIGRHVFEKGLHLLINCIPELVEKYPNVKIVVAGVGPMTEELKRRVYTMGCNQKVFFTGYLEEEAKIKLYKLASAAVFPSLYEPFGIVALEAMAAGCPVIAADTGGLSEIIEQGVNGIKTTAGSQESLCTNLLKILNDSNMASRIITNGYNCVKDKFNWNHSTALTHSLYQQVQLEAKGTIWEVSESKHDLKAV